MSRYRRRWLVAVVVVVSVLSSCGGGADQSVQDWGNLDGHVGADLCSDLEMFRELDAVKGADFYTNYFEFSLVGWRYWVGTWRYAIQDSADSYGAAELAPHLETLEAFNLGGDEFQVHGRAASELMSIAANRCGISFGTPEDPEQSVLWIAAAFAEAGSGPDPACTCEQRGGFGELP